MKTATILTITILALFLLAFFILSRTAGGRVVIDSKRTLGGTQIILKQSYNQNFGEPYTVDFFYKRKGEPWKWFYIDHEDTRWWSGEIKVFSENKIEVWRGRTLVAVFDSEAETFYLSSLRRTAKGPSFTFPSETTEDQLGSSSKR